MKKEELIAIADECLLDAWKKYQDSKGITSGDISPEDSLSWDGLMGQVADFIIKVSNHNLPTFLDDEEKMADFKILSKEEFLSSYSYISEEEYDHTKEMKELYEDEKETSNDKDETNVPVAKLPNTKKYYAITASMDFRKTVLIPIETVEDLDEAIALVDKAVEKCEIDLLGSDADYKIISSSYPNNNGIHELVDEDACLYQILYNETPERNYDFDEICPYCDHVNQVKWDRKSHSIICEGCGKRILLCNLCEDNECGKCPHESE